MTLAYKRWMAQFEGGDDETVGSGDCNSMSLCIVPPRTLPSLLTGRKAPGRGGVGHHSAFLKKKKRQEGLEERCFTVVEEE